MGEHPRFGRLPVWSRHPSGREGVPMGAGARLAEERDRWEDHWRMVNLSVRASTCSTFLSPAEELRTAVPGLRTTADGESPVLVGITDRRVLVVGRWRMDANGRQRTPGGRLRRGRDSSRGGTGAGGVDRDGLRRHHLVRPRRPHHGSTMGSHGRSGGRHRRRLTATQPALERRAPHRSPVGPQYSTVIGSVTMIPSGVRRSTTRGSASPSAIPA